MGCCGRLSLDSCCIPSLIRSDSSFGFGLAFIVLRVPWTGGWDDRVTSSMLVLCHGDLF